MTDLPNLKWSKDQLHAQDDTGNLQIDIVLRSQYKSQVIFRLRDDLVHTIRTYNSSVTELQQSAEEWIRKLISAIKEENNK